ncbi:MAG: hypothetical protein ABIH69_02550 [bacterium]|nr:hypothetical protein [Candidatus Margulisiibacteriota bacterium]
MKVLLALLSVLFLLISSSWSMGERPEKPTKDDKVFQEYAPEPEMKEGETLEGQAEDSDQWGEEILDDENIEKSFEEE